MLAQIVLLLTLTSSICALEPVILLFGPPGAGKGTFADFAKDRSYNHISAGDLIRDEINKETPFGLEIKELVERGDYVDPATLFQLMQARINQCIADNKPFIIDGYGRTQEDIEALCTLLIEKKFTNKTLVVFLDSDDEECKARIVKRLVCNQCNHVFNEHLDWVHANSSCPICLDGTIQTRLNDTSDVIYKRLKKYREEIFFNYKKSENFFPSITIDTNRERKDCYTIYHTLLEDLRGFEGNASEFISIVQSENQFLN